MIRQFLATILICGSTLYLPAAEPTEQIAQLFTAAESGNASAQYELARRYDNGSGVAKDEAEAVKWYTKAAVQGLAAAQYDLGVCYKYGTGVAKDEAEAVKWFTKAAEQGLAAAQYHIGTCYANGSGVAKDETEAVKWFTKAAEQGLVAAQYHLGFCYKYGTGVAKDEKEAVKWYTKAAEQGLAAAQYQLAICINNGIGVAKDEAKAVEWYTKAAEQGHAAAQCDLGVCYENGEGVPVDMAKAVQLYTLAAEQDYAQAQCYLGMCYEDGTGVAKNYKKAAELYDSAAKNNHLESKFYLGQCYYMGLGVDRDINKAASLTKEAADAGYAEAKTMLALFYVMGTDVTPRNLEKADQLLNEAKTAGETEVSEILTLILNNKDDEETNRAKNKLSKALQEATIQYGPILDEDFNLGIIALNMFGFSIDVDSGVSQKNYIQQLKKSSDNNNPQAQFMYAMYLFDTEGDNSKDGIKYLTLAKEQNYDLAKYALMFRNKDMGIQEDPTETLQEMMKKANEGDAACQFLLGGWYYSLPPEDEERAQCIKWWEKALENHFAPAAYQLGLYYYEIERYEESVKYLLQASEIAVPNTQSTIFHLLHQLHSDKNIKIDKKKMEELRQRLQKHGRNFDNDYSGFFSQLKMVVSTLYKVAMYIMNNISGLS